MHCAFPDFLVHSALVKEIILNYKRTSAKEIILSVKLAEYNSVCNIFTYKSYHFSLYIIKLLFIELEIMKNDFLCKVTDSKIVQQNCILGNDIINE